MLFVHRENKCKCSREIIIIFLVTEVKIMFLERCSCTCVCTQKCVCVNKCIHTKTCIVFS